MLNKKTFGHRKPSRRSAFSLIELSIVLIIIGLLISGIIGGASLIKSATLRSVMTEARGYNIAASAFFTKYNALPGDYNSQLIGNGIITSFAGDAGNGDGTISYVNGSSATISQSEGQVAIKHLYADGSLDVSMFGTYPYLAATVPVYGTAATAVLALTPRSAIPGGKLKGSGWFFDNYQSSSADNINYNVAVLSGGVIAKTYAPSTALNAAGSTAAAVNSWTAAGNGSLSVIPILNPQDARSIDVKMDDGLPATGIIRSASASLGAATTAAASCTSALPNVAPATADTYNTTASTVNCALAFRIDPTS